MRTTVLTTLFAATLLAAALPGGPATAISAQDTGDAKAARSPAIDRPVPDFKLEDLRGKTHVLGDLKAKSKPKREGCVVVLIWWSATGPTAARTDPILNALFRKYEGKGVRFLAINPFVGRKPGVRGTESLAIVREFKRLRRIRYPVLLDFDKKVSRRFDARCVPEVMVIDRGGILRYRGSVVTPLIKPGERQYKRFLEDALNAVLAGKTVQTKKTSTWGNKIPY